MRYRIINTVLATTLLAACGSEEIDPGYGFPLQPNCEVRNFFADNDSDGFGDGFDIIEACDAAPGYVDTEGDCDDQNANANPNAAEVCDGVDNDCDGQIDGDDPSVDTSTIGIYYRDADGDGYGRAGDSVEGCSLPTGYAGNDDDCDDYAANVHPASTEVCDEVDNDCDGLVDFDDPSADLSGAGTYYPDTDGDGYGDGSGASLQACSRPYGYADDADDCDDSSAEAHPGASETCDGLDNDCDGTVDAADGACAGFAGTYAGSYSISAEEKLGSSVINSMHCNGTSTLEIDLNQSPALFGTVACTYSSGGGLFDTNQSGVVTGNVGIDGSISGRVVHDYDWDMQRTYNFSGTVSGGQLDATGTGSLWPHPQSAVAWEVELAFDGN